LATPLSPSYNFWICDGGGVFLFFENPIAYFGKSDTADTFAALIA
jgi:hypothetical protein